MLLTLLGRKKTGRDEAHGGEMRKKYADCVTTMPPEEAEWFGLSTVDALKKAKLETAKRTAEAKLPLKYALSRKLIEDLKSRCLVRSLFSSVFFQPNHFFRCQGQHRL